MKRHQIVFLFLFVLAVMISGCKYEYPTNINSPISPTADQIAMKINGSTSVNDTVAVERGVVVHFIAESLNPQIVSWSWEIYGVIIHGKAIEYIFTTSPPSYALVILRGVDINNNVYTISKTVKIVASVDGQKDIILVSSTPSGSAYNLVFAFKKAGMSYAAGSNYFYTGNVVNPHWTVTNILSADTNYNFVSGSLVNPASGVGKYVRVALTLGPGSYQMAVGKMVGTQQFWGTFLDSTLLKLTVHSDGRVSFFGDTLTNRPGSMGDQGSEAIVRWDFLTDRVILYLNNGSAFNSSKFVRFQDSAGTWQTPLAQVMVSGFPNWGKLEIAYTALPKSGLLVFNFGPEISQPLQFNSEASKSQYWDPRFAVLKAMIIRSPLSGRSVTVWTVVAVLK